MIRHSGCGSVGRTVASDTIGPRLESNHQSKLFLPTINSIEKTKIIKKMLGMAELKKTKLYTQFCIAYLSIWMALWPLFLYFRFSLELTVHYKTCQRLDSNRKPLLSDVNTLPLSFLPF